MYSIKLGMKWYDMYGANPEKLTEDIILKELEELDSVGKSRLLHYCYDTSVERFTQL